MRKGWIEVELEEVSEIISGKNQKKVDDPKGAFPIYGSGGIIGFAKKFLCEAGTTVIGRKGTINSPIYVKERFWNVDTAFGISPGSSINSKYLFYFCQGFNFKKLDKSTTIPSLAKRDLLKIKIPLAPLPEQRAIVAKIEQLFSELDNGIANLKKAQKQLKVYRQAVLKKAFEGELTREWRERQNNLPSVDDLLRNIGKATDDSKRGKKLEDLEISNNWVNVHMNDISSAIDPQPSHRTPPVDPSGIPYISIADIDKITGIVNFDGARKVSKKVLDEHVDRYNINEGDFVIGKIGTIGKPFFIPIERFYTLSANVVLLKPFSTAVHSKYLYYLCSSPIIEEQFKKGSKATTQSAFGIKKVRLLSVPLCSLKEQKIVIEEIESRLSVCDKLEETIKENLEKSEALRQSILKRAFEGKLLTEEELAACRREADWEPTEKLLERLRKEVLNV